MKPIHVFIGFDRRQPVAFQVAAHSVWAQTGIPITITRMDLTRLPMTRRGLTDFTFCRFLAPWLCDFHGTSIFLDSDVLVRHDLAELRLYPIMEPKTPVFVVKGKFKFEWASVMVFHNELCQMLTPLYVDNKNMNPLAFPWAHTIGELPKEWNHLVGYDDPDPKAKLVHFTKGLPIWPETEHCEFADAWHLARESSMGTCSYQTLMGRSVHVQHMKMGA